MRKWERKRKSNTDREAQKQNTNERERALFIWPGIMPTYCPCLKEIGHLASEANVVIQLNASEVQPFRQ